MPDAGTRVSHFVTHEPNTIVAWIGFGLVDRRASPGLMAGCICTVEPTGKIEIGWATANRN